MNFIENLLSKNFVLKLSEPSTIISKFLIIFLILSSPTFVLNNLNFIDVDKNQFPVVNILNNLPKKNSLYETVIVSANDQLVELFLNKKIKFVDISKRLQKILNLKIFIKYKHILPKNLKQILKLNEFVRLKTKSLSVLSR